MDPAPPGAPLGMDDGDDAVHGENLDMFAWRGNTEIRGIARRGSNGGIMLVG
jgi:hypothetical protein